MSHKQLSNILIAVLLLIFAVVIYLHQTATKRQREAIATIRKTSRRRRNFLVNLYKFFSEFPLSRNYFGKICTRLYNVYPADDMAVNLMATKIMLRSVVSAAAGIIFTVFVSSGDILFIALGLTVVYLLFTFFNDHALQQIETTLLHQFSAFIDGVRENYNRCGRVDDSVGELLDSLPAEISLHAEKIHNILVSTHVIEEAADYADIAPNQFFTTFMEVSSTTMEYGDKRMENGESLFLRNLNFLKEEVNTELLRRQSNNSKFTGLAAIAILPVFFIKPISMYWTYNIPDMMSYYEGAYGTITMALVFAICIICYRAIQYLKDSGKSQEIKEDGISKHIANFRPVKLFVVGQISRNYSQAVREEEMLRFTGDHLGINAFIVRRYMTAFIIAVATTLLLCTSVVRDRFQTSQNFSQAFQTSIVPNNEYREDMEKAAKEYLPMAKELSKNGEVSDAGRKSLITAIQKNTNVKEQRYATLVADAAIQRSENLQGIYFKWYYLIFIFGAGVIGYMAQYWVLRFKQSAVTMDMEDEVSQFQTIVLMLMHVDGVSTQMVLDWIERFAFCFRSSIEQCIYELPYRGQKALEDLRENETFPSFQSFANNLINVDNVGVAAAFSGIEIDREYYKEKRKEDNKIMIRQKSNAATILSFVPLFFILFGYFLFPVAQYALAKMAVIGAQI